MIKIKELSGILIDISTRDRDLEHPGAHHSRPFERKLQHCSTYQTHKVDAEIVFCIPH